MKQGHLPLYAIAVAILVVGLAFAGVPVQTILIGLVVLACPLMMMFMMGGHGGGGGPGGSDHGADQPYGNDHGPTARR